MTQKTWQWHEQAEIQTAGRAFREGVLLDGPQMADEILASFLAGRLADLLVQLNGSFAFVIGTWEHPIAAGVDRLRSIPLFYREGTDGRSACISTSAHRLRCGPSTPTPAAAAAFLRSGYTLGRSTLDPEVHQVLAGTVVRFGDDGVVIQERYHRHLRSASGSVALTNDHLDGISDAFGRRMVAVLDGRQALVPLSGGYDSRYVVSALAEQGYDDVQLFTYGAPNSFEVKIAERVAEAFGYPWTFVDYSGEGLVKFTESTGFADYWATQGNLAALPHVQEPFALAELERRRILRRDTVVLPGFCGDTLGGSFLPGEIVTGETDRLLRQGLSEHIVQRFLYLENSLTESEWASLRQALVQSLGRDTADTLEEFTSLAFAWAVEHRLARYVVNALRAYEVAGLDWYMPLWDTGLTEAWYQAPISDLRAKKRYNGYLLEHRFPRFGVDVRQYPKHWSSAWFRRLRRPIPRSVVRALWQVRDVASGTRRFDVNAFGPVAEWGSRPLGDAALPYKGNIVAALAPRYLHDVASDFSSLGAETVVRR